ncbi:MAG: hypothetical protein Q4G68_04275 [Planctomycetia bacterium]|nr:hypothetical protein [Planctomycetia bacterium]
MNRLNWYLVCAAMVMILCGCDANPQLTKKIRKTASLNKASDGYMPGCVSKLLKGERSDTIRKPKIAFCAVQTELNNESPFSLVTLIYVGAEPEADGVLLTLGEYSKEYPLSDWGSPNPDLVSYGADCKIDPEKMPKLASFDSAKIALTKGGEKISDDVELKATMHQWEDRDSKQLVYPWPGEKYSMMSKKVPFNKPESRW